MIFDLGLFLILLLFSGFFSGSEVALFHLNPIHIRKLQKQGKDTTIISKLIHNPARLLATILIGNMFVNICFSSLITSMTLEYFGKKSLSVSILLVTFILLIFGEVVPKTISIYNASKISIFAAKPLYYFSKIIFPLRFLFRTIAEYLIKIIGIEKEEAPLLTEDEFKTIIGVSKKSGVVKKSEHDMILSVLEFTDMQVDEIMVPRVDIKAVSSDISKEALISFIKQARHSKIPVYEGTIDKITGILYTKAIFLNPDRTLKELLKPVIYVPGSKKIDELLEIFNNGRTKMAVILDEFGGTDGIVTQEDILEEIFGEIYDEFETPEQLIVKLSENKYKISAKVNLDDIDREIDIELESADSSTLAAFALELFEKIPKVGDHVDYKGWRLTVESMAGKRIVSLILEKI